MSSILSSLTQGGLLTRGIKAVSDYLSNNIDGESEEQRHHNFTRRGTLVITALCCAAVFFSFRAANPSTQVGGSSNIISTECKCPDWEAYNGTFAIVNGILVPYEKLDAYLRGLYNCGSLQAHY